MEPSLFLLARAADFAARRHRFQRRKDIDATPYINHLTEVAALLAAAGADAALIAAGYLHDTIEDVEVTFEELELDFGRDVAELVAAVTDDKSLPREQRKRLQVEHAAAAPPRVGSLKLADKISNLRSIRDTPPAQWPPDRVTAYVQWAHEVASAVDSPLPGLWAEYLTVRGELLARHGLAAPTES